VEPSPHQIYATNTLAQSRNQSESMMKKIDEYKKKVASDDGMIPDDELTPEQLNRLKDLISLLTDWDSELRAEMPKLEARTKYLEELVKKQNAYSTN
jgi:hypothetical protein